MTRFRVGDVLTIPVAGDETRAHHWYRRASELDSTEARRILARTDAD